MSGFIFEFLWTVWVAYAAYINFFQKRFTKFGLDAIILYLLQIFFGKKNVDLIRNNARAVKRMAIMMTLVCIGGIWDILPFFMQNILPHLR